MQNRGFLESIAHSRAASGGEDGMRASAPPRSPRLRARYRERVPTDHAKARCRHGHGKTRYQSRLAAASMRQPPRAVRSCRFPKASSSNWCRSARVMGCVPGRIAPVRSPQDAAHRDPRKPSAGRCRGRRHSGSQKTEEMLQTRGEFQQTQVTCKKNTFIPASVLRYPIRFRHPHTYKTKS